MQRFYFPSIPNESFTSDDPHFVHQVSRVLRMAPGDRVILFSDDGGGEYEFVSATKREVSFRRIREILPPVDSGPSIVLFQSLPNRFEKIEYLLQKGTEVGISEFVFFSAERSQKLSITPNKIERFEAIVREALEQCGGFRKPSVSFVSAPSKPFEFPVALFHTSGSAMGIWEFAARLDGAKGGTPLSSAASVWMLVGPEGGFSDSEVETFLGLWAAAVRAGERILRTETTGVVAAFSFLRMLEK